MFERELAIQLSPTSSSSAHCNCYIKLLKLKYEAARCDTSSML